MERNIDWHEICCCECGFVFKIPTASNVQLVQSKRMFYCLNGHIQSYTGDTVEKQLRNEITRLKGLKPEVIEREVEVIIEVEKEPKDLGEFYRDHEHKFKNSKNNPCSVCGVYKAVAEIVKDIPTHPGEDVSGKK